MQTVLQTLRAKRGVSQKGLAAQCRLNNTVLSHVEAGRRPMSVEVATKSAPMLGADPIRLYIDHNVAAIKA